MTDAHDVWVRALRDYDLAHLVEAVSVPRKGAKDFTLLLEQTVTVLGISEVADDVVDDGDALFDLVATIVAGDASEASAEQRDELCAGGMSFLRAVQEAKAQPAAHGEDGSQGKMLTEMRYVAATGLLTLAVEPVLELRLRSGQSEADVPLREELSRLLLLRSSAHIAHGNAKPALADAVLACGVHPAGATAYDVAIQLALSLDLKRLAQELHGLCKGRASTELHLLTGAAVEDFDHLRFHWAPPVQCWNATISKPVQVSAADAMFDRPPATRLVCDPPTAAAASNRVLGCDRLDALGCQLRVLTIARDDTQQSNTPECGKLAEILGALFASSPVDTARFEVVFGLADRRRFSIAHFEALNDLVGAASGNSDVSPLRDRSALIEWQFSYNSSLQGDKSTLSCELVQPTAKERSAWDVAAC
jgi:hypothetical protein